RLHRVQVGIHLLATPVVDRGGVGMGTPKPFTVGHYTASIRWTISTSTWASGEAPDCCHSTSTHMPEAHSISGHTNSPPFGPYGIGVDNDNPRPPEQSICERLRRPSNTNSVSGGM